MRGLYTIGIHIASAVLHLVALFNSKIRLGVEGRKRTFKTLENTIFNNNETIWMHCASLGEYEQGLPVLQKLKVKYPKFKIVVSFFSPSGYEIKKNTPLADAVVYLPLDTKRNAKRFLDAVNPKLSIFIKYEIWPNLLLEIKKRNLKAILVSANFRRNQSFFKWYGSLFRESLFAFDHIFTQNKISKSLVEAIGYTSLTISGDTRFDRVSQQLLTDNTIDFIESFKDDKITVIFGSSWAEDDTLFIPFINTYASPKVKFIIAPHKIHPDYTRRLKKQLHRKTFSYSEKSSITNFKDYQVLILDTIGYLSKAYSYADIAYVGGAAGNTGLHNVLEPAAFGVPIIIGKNYNKFPEAIALVNLKGILSVTNQEELGLTLEALIENVDKRQQQGAINANYVKVNKGALLNILDYISFIFEN